MAITRQTKQLLRQSAEQAPQRVAQRSSLALKLRLTNGKQVFLMNKKGQLTEAGKFWYSEVRPGQNPTGFSPDAEVVRRHRTEYVKMNNGAEGVMRVWQPATKSYKYTDLGREYYREKPRRYIVSIPAVWVKGSEQEDSYKGHVDARAQGKTIR